jgi:hypothetical protein
MRIKGIFLRGTCLPRDYEKQKAAFEFRLDRQIAIRAGETAAPSKGHAKYFRSSGVTARLILRPRLHN